MVSLTVGQEDYQTKNVEHKQGSTVLEGFLMKPRMWNVSKQRTVLESFFIKPDVDCEKAKMVPWSFLIKTKMWNVSKQALC